MKKSLVLLMTGYMMFGIDVGAFDNQIIIEAEVLDKVELEVLSLEASRDALYLHSRNSNGATVTVKHAHVDRKQKIYHNGELQSLPLTYDLHDGPFVLASADVDYKHLVRVDIRAH